MRYLSPAVQESKKGNYTGKQKEGACMKDGMCTEECKCPDMKDGMCPDDCMCMEDMDSDDMN